MLKGRYNLKYCCDDVCIFPSSTLLNYDGKELSERFSDSFGLTAISTYQLKVSNQNGVQKKKGKVYLFRLAEKNNKGEAKLEMCDFNFFKICSCEFVRACVHVIASADVKEGNQNHMFATPCEKNNSGLSFEAFDNKPEKICVSFSNGDVCILVDGNMQKLWKAHEYHVWSCAFCGNENVVTTGSDDCSFTIWDLRSTSFSQKNKRELRQLNLNVSVIGFTQHREEIDMNIILANASIYPHYLTHACNILTFSLQL
ncbi:diphthine methyltransferase, putative (DPH7) [Plasmodium ovale curtisi]|uniref:methylated diphthine methylhydrolase n=1 Tax=Plasmodium ovale curtisi TaxID=864141 RepID=A0A1A8W0P3_PLAOA|nr:diphthine methyltransferase, putative (DPH7) [Plasmodium ovale curtisi]